LLTNIPLFQKPGITATCEVIKKAAMATKAAGGLYLKHLLQLCNLSVILLNIYKERNTNLKDDEIMFTFSEKWESLNVGYSWGYLLKLRYLYLMCRDYPHLMLAEASRIKWMHDNIKRIREAINKDTTEKMFWKTFGPAVGGNGQREILLIPLGTSGTKLHELMMPKAPLIENIEPIPFANSEAVKKIIEPKDFKEKKTDLIGEEGPPSTVSSIGSDSGYTTDDLINYQNDQMDIDITRPTITTTTTTTTNKQKTKL
jgi:hypothetical protein